MQKTIFDVLTDETARSTKAVEASLDQEFAVGAPWFSKTVETTSEFSEEPEETTVLVR